MRRDVVAKNSDRQTCAKQACLVLGTAQLGLAHGAANSTGVPSEAEAIMMVRTAIQAGVRSIDTARVYGDSERRIGLALAEVGLPPVAIVTKLDPMTELPEDTSAERAVAATHASLAASRLALSRDRLDVLLLHRASHRTDWGGAVWRLLRAEREAGRIGRLGVSVQSPQEALAALKDDDVCHLQLPYNLLDRRWDETGVVDTLRRTPNVVVHARSVLLQGLLTGSPHTLWPMIAGVAPRDVITRLASIARDLSRKSVADLAFAFVRAQNWIDGIVIGMEMMDQLTANLMLFQHLPLTVEQALAVRTAVPFLPDSFLDPALWPHGRIMLGDALPV